MSYPVLFRALAGKRIALLKRYPINTISQLFVTYAFFAGIFFGGQAVAGPAITDSLPGIIVGFFVWTMAITAFASVSQTIMQEAQWGTLEQLYMSPFGFDRVMLVNGVVRLVESLAWGAIMLVAMLVTTQEPLTVDLLTVAPLVVLTVASALGVGFVFASLALVYKRIENVFSLLTIALLFLVAAPVDQYPVLAALPLSQGTDLLTTAMSQGTPLWALPPVELVILAGTAVAYLGLGVLVFRFAERRSRRDGLLGQY